MFKKDKIHIVIFLGMGIFLLSNNLFSHDVSYDVQLQFLIVSHILAFLVLGGMGYWDLLKENIFISKKDFVYLLPAVLELVIMGIGATVIGSTLLSQGEMTILKSIKDVMGNIGNTFLSTLIWATKEEITTTFLWGVAAMLLIKVIRKARGWNKKNFLWAGLIINVIFALLHVQNAMGIYQIFLEDSGVILSIVGGATVILFAFVFGMYSEMVFFKTHSLLLTILVHTLINVSREITILEPSGVFGLVAPLIVYNLVTCVYGLMAFWIYKSNWSDTFWERALGMNGQTEPL